MLEKESQMSNVKSFLIHTKLISWVTIAFLIASLLVGCKSTASIRAYTTKDMTTQELNVVADKFSEKLGEFFAGKSPIFFSLLSSINNTTSIIPLGYLENQMVKLLIGKGLYAVRREDRKEALQEMKLIDSGLGQGRANLGNMQSPDYFLKIKVEENQAIEGKKEVIERLFSLDVRDVSTQLTVFTDSFSIQYENQIENKRR